VDERPLPVRARRPLLRRALYDGSPWATIARETAWLVGLAALFGGLARLSVRRLAV
jgi:hypothetical protein